MQAKANEPRLFTLFRYDDETGVSGTGRVLDGVIFHTGQVVVCWRSDIHKKAPAYSSISIYESWDAFKFIHVDPHPEGSSRISFVDGSAVK